MKSQAASNVSQLDHSLDTKAPLHVARVFLLNHYFDPPAPLLCYLNGEFFRWNGSCYVAAPQDKLRAQLYEFLEGYQDLDGKRIKPTRRIVDDALDALRAAAHLEIARAPCWLMQTPPEPADDFVACKNGLLNVRTRTLTPANPRFFTTNALGFEYDPTATKPDAWLQFLKEIFENDNEAIEALQEWSGYLITADTSQQKGVLLVGPKRSGKGTIGRVWRALVGPENCTSPSLATLGMPFGLAGLVGKSVAILSDVRLSGRTDSAAIAENLLRISGEDAVSVPRKFTADWVGQLGIRFVLLSNELPALTDASGALVSRFILIQTCRSFFGKEDPGLTGRLLQELPAILNWSLDGLDRLRARGHFLQPGASIQALEQLEMLGSPTRAFVADRCTLEPGAEIACADLFHEWCQWCELQNRDRPGTQQTFGRNLAAAAPGIKGAQRRDGSGGRHRIYVGIRLRREHEE